MQRTLADFRIESDQVVCLTFTNGCSYRVDAKDLDRFLSRQDLRRVQRALQLRRQFMQRISPPTALVLVLVAIVGLGRYDVYRVTHSWLVPASSKATMTTSKTLPAPAGQSPSSKKPHLTVMPTTATAASSHAAAATRVARTAAHRAMPSVANATTAHTPGEQSAPTLVKSLTQPTPISQTTKALPPVLSPVTAPLAHAIQQLPNLLP